MLPGAGADLGLQINTAATGTAGPSGEQFTVSGSQQLELFGASRANVSFASGSAGTLKLDASSVFTGHILGCGGAEKIDLSDIAFGAETTLGYSANNANTGGTLTVSDGSLTASIALLGQYMSSQFAISGDSFGGTLISDPPPSQQQLLT